VFFFSLFSSCLWCLFVFAQILNSQAMMVEVGPWILWFNAAILVTVAGLAIVSVYIAAGSWRQLPKAASDENEKELYSDEDGIATEETQKSFSVKRQNWILSIVTVAGFAVALVEGVQATIHGWTEMTSIWIEFATWVCH
jgi:hypothetical protein